MFLLKKFRKLIGIIIAEPDSPYQKKLLTGIIEQAFALNYDIAVFSMLMKDALSEEWHIGESNIYSMINYTVPDGIIFVPDTLRVNDIDKKVEKDIREKFHKPVVSVDMGSEYFNSIFTDDVQNIKKIVSHLIEKHKLTDIAFMTGIRGHLHATNRLTGYYEALIEHNLPIDQSRVFYGDFWYNKGEEVVQALINDGRPMPQAIACASDTMAVSVCEALKARGYRIPEDIAVTGYDSIEAGINYVPCITSSDIPSDNTGKRAVKLLHSLITGEKFKDEICSTDIIIGKSCGCDSDAAEEIRKKYASWQDDDASGNFNSAYNFMLDALISQKDLEAYMGTLAWYTYQIGNNSDFYICLCENWDSPEENEQSPDYRKAGYTKTMTVPLRKMGETKKVNPDFTFETSEMLPALYERHAKPKAFFFSPVHFNDRCFGYAVFSDSGDGNSHVYPSCYKQWMRYVCCSLESLRRQRNLIYMYKKMEDNAVTDLLTGIYNRNGFNLYAEQIFRSAKKSGKKFTLILGDLNNLKYINDTFGHVEGDFAIKTAAEAFKRACRKNMSCFRIGGDEYVLAGSEISDIEEISEIKASVEKYLKIINDTADKPYSISISIGVFSETVDNYESIENPFTVADERMFEAKEKFKREDGFDYRKMRSS